MGLLKQLIAMSRDTDKSQITISIVNKQVMVVMQDIVSIDRDNNVMKAMIKTSSRQYDAKNIDECVVDLIAAKWQPVELPIDPQYMKQIQDEMEKQLPDIDEPDITTKQ